MRMGAGKAYAESMAGPINQSFSILFNTGSPGGRISDTTLIEYPWTCAKISEIKHDDGSVTTIYDYGEGCEDGSGDYTYFMHGKYTSTYKYTDSRSGSIIKNTYSYISEYDNYGGSYNNNQNTWLMDGFGRSAGESEYDSINQTFSGAYAYESEATYQYDTINYYYKNKSSTRYSQDKYILESSETNYTYGNDYYKSKVLEPLVSDYSCYTQYWSGTDRTLSAISACYIWVTFVKGRERVQYKNGDEEGSFEVNYGDGDCDNLVIIYENGKFNVVDLGKGWYY